MPARATAPVGRRPPSGSGCARRPRAPARRGVRLEWFTVAWNVAEALVAIAAGVAAGSIALIGFGVDSGIEVIAASALLWRFRQAKADASEAEHDRAEQRALYIVSATYQSDLEEQRASSAAEEH